MERDLTDVRATLASARAALGLSQRDLAERCSLDHSAISRLEGGSSNPSVPTLIDWANALGYEVALVPAGTAVLVVEEADALRTVLNAALAEHTRRNPPPLRDDTAGFGLGDPRRGRW